MTHGKAFSLVVLVFCLIPVWPTTVFSQEVFELNAGDYSVNVASPGFRFGVTRNDQSVLPPDSSCGLSFLDGEVKTVELVGKNENVHEFLATNVDGQVASVKVATEQNWVSIEVKLDGVRRGRIALRTESPGTAAYGLGDSGSFGENANLCAVQKKYSIAHDGHGHRFLTSFVIFPKHRVAGAFYANSLNHVDVGPDYYEMSVEDSNAQTFHFFLGDVPEIYSAFKVSRTNAGFPGVPPKRIFFELGWESWDALRWNTSSQSVKESIQSFLNNGYHVKWAVTGSGFWDTGGTTLSFGNFNKTKYPDANQDGVVDVKTWFEQKKIAWLIGQRTNFVIPGGPHSSKPGESGGTLFETSPDTDNGVRGGFFLANDDGLFQAKSTVFPTVACYLLDGNRAGAAEWFEGLYQGWRVDGVKEDTMMSVPDHTIYNRTMRTLAENGALVMARCGSYSSPGTLTRINDTNGPSSMTLRAPINYLQYAASGSPNVYSDTVGFGHMQHPVPAIRHAWLCSLTAGMSVGSGPWKWPQREQQAFKKAIDFHYALGPYLFSCATESYQSGFPHILTPLPIAFPDDDKTYNLSSKENRQFQWMVGPSLLAAPLLTDSYKTNDRMDIYLPAGKWMDYETGDQYLGPTTLKAFRMPLDKTPVFVGGKGVLVRREQDGEPLIAVIYPIALDGSIFRFTHPDGISTSTITNNNTNWDPVQLELKDTTTKRRIEFKLNRENGAISFELKPGHNYELSSTTTQGDS